MAFHGHKADRGCQMDRRGGGKSCPVGDFAMVQHVIAAEGKAPLCQMNQNGLGIIAPVMGFLVNGVLQLKIHLQLKVGGGQTIHIVLPLADQHEGAEGQGSRKNVSAVVVGMLADQVNPAGGEEHPDVCRAAAMQLHKTLLQLLHICHG
ncbi:hypothetical protein D3C75_952400 [compost metagenome]